MTNKEEPVIFYPEPHIYVHRASGKRLPSVTTIIKSFSHPFDSEFWSYYKAIEALYGVKVARFARYNHDPNESISLFSWIDHTEPGVQKDIEKKAKEIKEGWNRKGSNARRAGTKVHDKYENMVKHADIIMKNNKPMRPMDIWIPDRADFTSSGIATEVTIYNIEYEIAGRVDRIDKDGKDLEIIDYKTNEEIKTQNPWQSMKEPLSELDDCSFSHYLLQLNTYGWMLEQFGFNSKKLTLVHTRSGEEMDVPRRFDLVEQMLKAWKNGNKIKTSNYSDKKNTVR